MDAANTASSPDAHFCIECSALLPRKVRYCPFCRSGQPGVPPADTAPKITDVAHDVLLNDKSVGSPVAKGVVVSAVESGYLGSLPTPPASTSLNRRNRWGRMVVIFCAAIAVLYLARILLPNEPTPVAPAPASNANDSVPTSTSPVNSDGHTTSNEPLLTSPAQIDQSAASTSPSSSTDRCTLEARPTFKCPGEGYADEKAICENPDLATIECRMMSTYRALAAKQADKRIPSAARA